MSQWIFTLEGGGPGELVITDELFLNEEIAEQRAKAEFLEKGHKKINVSFATWRTDIKVGDIVRIEGLPYLVLRTHVFWRKGEIGSSIEAVRYE